MQLNMNNRFAVINFSPNLNIRRRTIKLRQLKAMFTFTTLRLHLHTIEYRMPLRGEFRLEIFQFPYWLSNPKFRPPALSFGAQKKFRSESLTVIYYYPGLLSLQLNKRKSPSCPGCNSFPIPIFVWGFLDNDTALVIAKGAITLGEFQRQIS